MVTAVVLGASYVVPQPVDPGVCGPTLQLPTAHPRVPVRWGTCAHRTTMAVSNVGLTWYPLAPPSTRSCNLVHGHRPLCPEPAFRLWRRCIGFLPSLLSVPTSHVFARCHLATRLPRSRFIVSRLRPTCWFACRAGAGFHAAPQDVRVPVVLDHHFGISILLRHRRVCHLQRWMPMLCGLHCASLFALKLLREFSSAPCHCYSRVPASDHPVPTCIPDRLPPGGVSGTAFAPCSLCLRPVPAPLSSCFLPIPPPLPQLGIVPPSVVILTVVYILLVPVSSPASRALRVPTLPTAGPCVPGAVLKVLLLSR